MSATVHIIRCTRCEAQTAITSDERVLPEAWVYESVGGPVGVVAGYLCPTCSDALGEPGE